MCTRWERAVLAPGNRHDTSNGVASGTLRSCLPPEGLPLMRQWELRCCGYHGSSCAQGRLECVCEPLG